MVPLFTAAIFVAAFLLFMVQPLAARLVLPYLGGSPAVWTGTMMFFQVMLLAGYAYAHAVGRLRGRVQGVVHGTALAACLAFLPLALPGWWGAEAGGGPLASLLLGLLASVGLPFFVVSSASPLIQAWFARTGHARAHDPYFLYAASNAGSLLGLLSYPVVVGPWLGLRAQGWAWGIGFVLCAGLLAACWWMGAGRGEAAPAGDRVNAKVTKGAKDADQERGGSQRHSGASEWRERLIWIALAAAPSSLSLGVTQFLTTDVAAVPLLWVVPLSVYLITFIASFSRHGARGERVGRVLLPLAAIAVTGAIMARQTDPLWLLALIHLGALAAAGLACHGRLAMLRPAPARLTEYFLLMSLGGALGGAFNAVVAPLVFGSVLEYPIALAACVGLLAAGRAARARREPAQGPQGERPPAGAIAARPARAPLFRVTLTIGGAVLLMSGYLIAAEAVLGYLEVTSLAVMRLVTILIPCALALGAITRPLVMAGLVAVLAGQATMAPVTISAVPLEIEHMERSFFGVHVVVLQPGLHDSVSGLQTPPLRMLRHGTTGHGQQWLDPVRRFEPLAYFARVGPVGDAMQRLDARIDSMAVIGLGAGTMAAYGREGRRIDFFEIDPVVARLAQDETLFSYLHDSASPVRVVIGDGRLTLAREPEGSYDAIVLDAFSSDSIPVHLLTVEALELYRSRLAAGGVLIIHISNRNFDLLPVVARGARAVGMEGVHRGQGVDLRTSQMTGVIGSHWVVLSKSREPLGVLGASPLWHALPEADGRRPWTDDHANALEALHW